jgi:uncharacterized RDD family membrane protein YckC
MQAGFGFGKRVTGYKMNVLNKREVRASAGILFFLAMIACMAPLAWPAPPTVEIIAMAHPPVVAALQPLRAWGPSACPAISRCSFSSMANTASSAPVAGRWPW